MNNFELKSQLTSQELLLVSSELDKRKKSAAIAYVLCIFLWGLGAHRFYTGNIVSALLTIVAEFIGVTLFFVTGLFLPFINLIFLFPLMVWFVIDLVWLNGRVNEVNTEIEKRIIQQVYNQRSQMM